MGYLPYQLVQDFFHQQYYFFHDPNTSNWWSCRAKEYDSDIGGEACQVQARNIESFQCSKVWKAETLCKHMTKRCMKNVCWEKHLQFHNFTTTDDTPKSTKDLQDLVVKTRRIRFLAPEKILGIHNSNWNRPQKSIHQPWIWRTSGFRRTLGKYLKSLALWLWSKEARTFQKICWVEGGKFGQHFLRVVLAGSMVR